MAMRSGCARGRRMWFWRGPAVAAAAACTIGGAFTARAQVWDGGGVAGGDVNWTTGTNWDTNVAPVNNGTALVTMAGTIDTTNTVNVNYDIFALIINNTAGAFTINGGAGVSLTTRGGGIINNDNQAQTINVPLIVNTGQTWAAQASPLVINGAVNLGANQLFFDSNIFLSTNSAINGTISGASGSIVKNGAGPMVLGGNNTFGGGVTLNTGSVAPFTNTALGTGTFTVNGGAVVNISAGTRTLANPVTVGGDFTTAGTAALVFSGPATLTGNRTITTDFSTTFSGVIGQDVVGRQLTKIGAGSLTFSGAAANTYTGQTTARAGSLTLQKPAGVNAIGGNLAIGNTPVFSAAQVFLGADNQIPDTAAVEVFPTAFFNLGSFNETITTLDMMGGSVTGTGTLTVTSQILHDPFPSEHSVVSAPLNFGGQTVTANIPFSFAPVQMTLSGPVTNGGLTKDGTGVLRMDGAVANTYSGTTTVNEGMLQLAKSSGAVAIAGPLTIGDGTGSDVVQLHADHQIADAASVTINGSGTLDLGAFNEVVAGLNMTGGGVTGTSNFLGVTSVTGNASTNTATIGGNTLGLGGGTRTFAVADGGAAVDVDVTATVNSGGINKTGAGTLRLAGTSANTLSLPSFVTEGTLLLGKSAGVAAINQTLNIGDAAGGADADVVRLAASEQIGNGVSVFIARSGLLDLGDQDETLSSLELTAGHVVGGGLDGTLLVGGALTTVADTSSSVIEAEVNLTGTSRTFTVPNGAVADDLIVNGSLINGSLFKQGTGTLRLTGTVDNTISLAQVSNGTVVMDKTSGLDAFSGALATVGDGAGGAQSDVLRYGAGDHQLPDSIAVRVQPSGLFDLNGRSDTIGRLEFIGPGVVSTGAGTLTVADSVATFAFSSGFGTVSGNLNLAGGVRPFDVVDSTPVIDLSVSATLSNGTLQKQGAGTLQLTGGAMTSAISYQLDAGTLSATGLVLAPSRMFTQNGGTFTGTLNNQGSFVYSGGIFNGTFANNGAATFNANFTAADGISNTTHLLVTVAGSVAADGGGFTNEGTVELAGGTLTGSGPIVNQALITGRGTIGGSAGFTNNGLVSVSGGNLTLSNFASNTNSGNFDLAPGLQLRLQGAQLLNAGTLNLNGGTVNGFAALFNDAGGTVAGRGNITTSFTNNGTLMPDGGTLAVNMAFTNGGTILLGGAPASLTTSTVTNNGIIRGDGTVNASVNNNANGEIRAENGKSLLFVGPAGTNNGKVNLLGGTVQFIDPLGNGATGLITGRGTLIAAGGLTNNGQVQLSAGFSDIHGTIAGNSGSKVIVSGGGTATFYDDVDMNAGSEFRVSTGSTAVFFGDVTGTNFFTGSGTKIFEAGQTMLDELASVAGDTVVESSAALTADRIDEDALTVNGRVTLAAGSGAPASAVNSLSVAAAASIDINDGGLVITNGGQAGTQQATALAKTGLENGGAFDWLGPGISSTEAFNNNTAAGSVLYGVGVLQNNVNAAGAPDGTTTDATAGSEIYTSFKGQAVTLNDTLIRYTYMGDADLSGDVTSTDYSLIDSGFALTLSGWVNGDFDYSGAIDATDYALIDNAFAFQVGPLSEEFLAIYNRHFAMFGQSYVDALALVQSGAAVPEPAVGLALVGGLVGLVGGRSRRRR